MTRLLGRATERRVLLIVDTSSSFRPVSDRGEFLSSSSSRTFCSRDLTLQTSSAFNARFFLRGARPGGGKMHSIPSLTQPVHG
jgi:hypothetical protein